MENQEQESTAEVHTYSKAFEKHRELYDKIENTKCPNCGYTIKKAHKVREYKLAWFKWANGLVMGDEPEKYRNIEPVWVYENCFACELKKKINEKMIKSGIPETHINARFENYKTYPDKSIANSQRKNLVYLKNLALGISSAVKNNSIITLIGETGTGKGHMMSSMFFEILKQDLNKTLRFVKYPTLLQQIRATYNQNENTESFTNEKQIIDKYINTDLTVIDEIGIEKNTEFTMKILYEIVDTRFEFKNKPTILISNLSMDDLKDYMKKHHGRLYSRVFAKQNTLMNFQWEDYRTQNMQ